MCPPGTVAANASCLGLIDHRCTLGASCASGLCVLNYCRPGCPAGSFPDGAGSCTCSPTFFGASGGGPPCTPCGGGSTSAAAGASACTCPAPAAWDATVNACACPGNATFVAGKCLKSPGFACASSDEVRLLAAYRRGRGAEWGAGSQPCPSKDRCSLDKLRVLVLSWSLSSATHTTVFPTALFRAPPAPQCISGTCTSPANGVCVNSCPPGSSSDPASGLCTCNPGFSSADGFARCAPCGANATNAGFGGTACTCTAPAGSVWNATTNACECPPQRAAVNGSCRLNNGEHCKAGAKCASGLCNRFQVCASQCSNGSVPANGSCVCDANYFSTSKTGFCIACGGGSTQPAQGASTCTCTAPATWGGVTSNACNCPPGFTYANSSCLANLNTPCATGADCLSRTCSAGLCVSTCPAGSSDINSQCRCNPNSFNAVAGVPPCTACAAGAGTADYGSRACKCSSPAGSVWDAAGNACPCPNGTVAANGTCKADVGQPCGSGDDCASALCSAGLCAKSCPPLSSPASGNCQCDAGAFGDASGLAPCTACGGGSRSAAAGASACTCPASSAWEPNACNCVDPNKGFLNGTCLLVNNQPCSAGADCYSGTCSSGVCVSSCPANAERNALGVCECSRRFYSPSNGRPPCLACPPGATSGLGSVSCQCPSPLVWVAANGSCACPPGTSAVANQGCLKVKGQPCDAGRECVSGLCAVATPGADSATCVSDCPAGSSPGPNGTCACAAGFFGPGGAAPCAACGPGAASSAAASSCTCPAASGAAWSAATNACVCPRHSTFVAAASGGACLLNVEQACTNGSQCLSRKCSSSSGSGFCVSNCPSGSSDASGVCACDVNFYSLSGQPAPTCTACPPGSSAPTIESTGCVCTSPAGSVWDAAAGACSCPANTRLSGGACKLDDGRPCADAAGCASGLCAATLPGPGAAAACVAACPGGSAANAQGGCTCAAGYYSATGASPCTKCGGESSTAGPGASSCTCPANQVWQPDENGCTCPPGYAPGAGDACAKIDGQPCSAGAECKSQQCSSATGGVCVSSCSNLPGAALGAAGGGTCTCTTGYYSASGAPPCTRCAPGFDVTSSSPSGATACTCLFGLTWNATSNTCECPPGLTLTKGICLAKDGFPCSLTPRGCASGVCNNGICAAACGQGQAPDGAGGCTCAPGAERCALPGGGGACRDLSTSASDCGSCGNACPAGAACAGGHCICPDAKRVFAPLPQSKCELVEGNGVGHATFEYNVAPGDYYVQ